MIRSEAALFAGDRGFARRDALGDGRHAPALPMNQHWVSQCSGARSRSCFFTRGTRNAAQFIPAMSMRIPPGPAPIFPRNFPRN